MSDSPTVSVVIPLYNKVRHIRRAIDSALSQTHPDFELIVVDDGSTDGGGDVVRQIADSRIRLITQKNAGSSAARNRGIQEASCQLVAFLDADDEWRPHFLETVLDLWRRYPDAGAFATAYESSKEDLCRRPNFANCVEAVEGGLLPDYFVAVRGGKPVWSSAVMIPKCVFDEVGDFPVGVKRGEDLHMWTRIALRYRIAWSPRAGAVYHLDADNRACVVHPLFLDMPDAQPIEEFLASTAEAPSPRENIKESLMYNRLSLTKTLCLGGKKAEASDLVRKTAGTRQYRKQRLVIWCALCVPIWLVRALQKARGLH